MQRRHHAGRFAAVRADHLPRQKAGGRMRDGVVCVNDVEAEFACDLHNLVRQREQILRFAEQRIGRREHLVKREAGLKLAEPERRFRADEWHLVPPARKGLAQLVGYDAAAAHGGVTDDSDIHDRSVEGESFWPRHSRSKCGRSTGSRMTNPSAKSTPASTPNCASRLSMSVMKRGDVSRVCTAPALGGRN